jgi:hypothetical protein
MQLVGLVSGNVCRACPGILAQYIMLFSKTGVYFTAVYKQSRDSECFFFFFAAQLKLVPWRGRGSVARQICRSQALLALRNEVNKSHFGPSSSTHMLVFLKVTSKARCNKTKALTKCNIWLHQRRQSYQINK